MAYTGIYERTIFYNPVNKYSVISVKTSDRSIPEKARSAYRHRDNMIHFAAVGYELPRTDQVSMILDGEWKEGKNGFQLHVTKCEEVVPQTREGIKGYLSSRLIKGIGGKTAELIVDRFGADTLHVLENEPERLLEIRGVSKAKLEEIIASYNESRTLRDLMLLLAPFQITPTTATKIYDHFGAHSVDILRDNPFELCQISGFGFKRVDAIMRKNNWPLNSPMRIRGAVFAALEGAKGDGGHLYLDAEQLRKESMALLNSMIPVPQMRVKADDLEAVIDDMLLQGKIINSNGNYYLVKTFAQEDETARSIARLLCRPVERVDVQDLLTRVRRQLGVELSLRQTEAVHMVFRSDLSIITGSPGTGKTTVLKAVIEVFKLLKPSENILLAAPTGRASRRMAESTGVNNASTLHSLLGLFGEDGGFRKEEEDMLDAGLIIVDESSIEDLIAFQAGRTVDLSLKLDGLTTELIYENGQLIRLSTRGDGYIGENITHNAKAISGIPERIPYEDRLVVVGESFIHNSDFESLKSITDSAGNPYKNSRNLAAGSIRAFDAAICAQRHVSFLPFSVLEGFEEYTDWANGKHARLLKLTEFGFGVIHAVQLQDGDKAQYEQLIAQMREAAEMSDLPIDGLVLTYDEVDYSRTCGRTGHHFKDGLAFKFEDELYESVLRDIEWTPSRTGEIAPVAVLDSVVIDGCTVSRASLHNLSFIEGLELMPGCRVLVSKRNMIIPHIEENLERGHFDLDAVTPKHCPCCGAETRFHITDGGKKALFCDNPDCAVRKLRRFVHFVSKKAMDIEGLSEATLERLIARGWLHSFTDVYRLDHYMQEIICMDGFGRKSWDNLWGAIQRSRNTTFERYLIAMDIPMIGNHASKVLAKQFGSSPSDFEKAVENDFDFSQLPDFGETLHQNIHQWFAQEENRILWEELQEMVTIQTVTTETHSMESNPFVGCTMVVTGKVEPYTRSGINAKIESLGAVAGSSVTKKTDYLICGENAGSKLDKARALGIRVLSPGEFFQMIGE